MQLKALTLIQQIQGRVLRYRLVRGGGCNCVGEYGRFGVWGRKIKLSISSSALELPGKEERRIRNSHQAR